MLSIVSSKTYLEINFLTALPWFEYKKGFVSSVNKFQCLVVFMCVPLWTPYVKAKQYS